MRNPTVPTSIVQTMIADVMIMGLSVVIGALSARLLGVDGRGELAAIVLVPQIAFVISVLGVHDAVVFHVARRQFTIEAVFGAALILTVPLALLGTAGSLFLTPTILSGYGAHVRFAARVYAATIPIGLLFGVMMRLLQGTKRFATWNVFRVLMQLGPLLGLLILWSGRLMTPSTFAFVNLAFYTPVVIALCVVFYRDGLLRVRSGREPVRALWMYSWRAGMGTVPQIANFRLDQVIIAMFLSTHALGLYTAAVSWSIGFLPFASAYGSVVFPDVAEAASGIESFGLAMRRGLVVLFGGWIVYFALTPVVFRIIYGSAFLPAMPAVLILGLASLFLAANQMIASGVKGLGHPILVSVSEVSGLIATTLLLRLLVPSFGIVGAAAASLVAYAVTLFVLLIGLRQMTTCVWRDLLMTRGHEWKELGRELASAASRLRHWIGVVKGQKVQSLAVRPDAGLAE